MPLITLLILSACRGRGSCETETREVSDDVDVGDVALTAEEALEVASGTTTLAGEWQSGGVTDLTLALARGEGGVSFDDGTYIGAFGPFLNPIVVECVDRLEDSLLGKNSVVVKEQKSHQAYRLMIGDDSEVLL